MGCSESKSISSVDKLEPFASKKEEIKAEPATAPGVTSVAVDDQLKKEAEAAVVTESVPKAVAYPNAPKEKNADKIDPAVDQDYNRRACAAHNKYRAWHGALPVSIDWALANSAQKWAENMNKTKTMEHTEPKDRDGAGENLAMMGGDEEEMKNTDMATDMWYNEINDPGYDYKNQGFQKGTGHFTQVVWSFCTYVGHGISGGYVCGRYSPAGNVQGQFEHQVPRLIKGWEKMKAADDKIKADKKAEEDKIKEQKEREANKPKTKEEFMARKQLEIQKDYGIPSDSNPWSTSTSISTSGKVSTMTHTVTFKFLDGREETKEIIETFEEE